MEPSKTTLRGLWEFYMLFGHVDVPATYDPAPKVAGMVKRYKRKNTSLTNLISKESLYHFEIGVDFTTGDKRLRRFLYPPRNYTEFLNVSSDSNSSKEENNKQFLLWLVITMYNRWQTNKKECGNGLLRFQGVSRGFWVQWIFQITEKNPSGWIAVNDKKDCFFWKEVSIIITAMLNEHLEKYNKSPVELFEMLFLTKPSFEDNSFQKHQDAHRNIHAVDFAGAVSFCLGQSRTTKVSGGVRVFPNCNKQRSSKCSNDNIQTCNHISENIFLNPLEGLYVPDKLWHTSLYPKGGTQYNIVLFFRARTPRGEKKVRNPKVALRYSPLEYKKFTATEYIEKKKEKRLRKWKWVGPEQMK